MYAGALGPLIVGDTCSLANTPAQTAAANYYSSYSTVWRPKFEPRSGFGRIAPIKPGHHHYFQLAMPRQPLGEISNNLSYRDSVTDRVELTSNWCSYISY